MYETLTHVQFCSTLNSVCVYMHVYNLGVSVQPQMLCIYALYLSITVYVYMYMYLMTTIQSHDKSKNSEKPWR